MESARSTNQINPSNPLSCGRVIRDTPSAKSAFEEYTDFVLLKASAKNTEMRIQQGIIGVATEAGELLDALKKHMFQGRPIDVTNIKEECGDIWFYFTELMAAVNTDIFEVMEMNIAKLSKRYAKEFTGKESINRDIDKEREILEETPSRYSCKFCADTECNSKSLPQRVCKGFIDNRNYPIVPISWREAEQIAIDRKSPPQVFSDDSPITKKPCCGNCAERLKLKGCSRYVKTHNDGCCIDHKIME